MAEEDETPQRSKDVDEIVVTGTNIRGIAPDSSPTVVYDRDDIEKSGVFTTEQFVRSVPQVFGGGINSATARGLPNDLESRSNTTIASGINLRGLGAGATLTLLNGRRLAPAGTGGGFVDVSAFPLSAIDRIEVLTDGASSIYGGDAVAGVVNFTLRDDFQGAETNVSYGLVTEGDLDQIRVSQTFGTSWASGNALVSYEFFDQDALFASEKAFSRDALPSETLLPEQDRHSVIAALSQEITDAVTFKAMGFYADRDSFGSNNRDSILRANTANTEQFLISPSLEYAFSNDWRVVLGGDYSETNTEAITVSTLLPSNTLFSLLEPGTEASLASVDVIADGTLFPLPGGPMKLAFGGAYRNEEFAQLNFDQLIVEGDRQVWAAFGELFLPIVGSENRLPGVERLEITASARFDDYSDFGSSVNPKVGFLWSPFPGFNFRGSYSTSFNPPPLGLAVDTKTNAVADFAINPANPAVIDIPYLLIGPGSVPDLEAENSRTFTAGADYEFELGGGQLTLSSTYYNINFEDRIGPFPRPPGFRNNNELALILDSFPSEIITLNPSLNDVQTFIDFAASSGGEVLVVGGIDLSNIAFIADFRTRNLLSAKTQGLDFNFRYDIDTDFGAFNASFNANYIIDFTKQSFPTAAVIETLNRPFDPVDLRLRGGLGWARDEWQVSVFVNYTDNYEDIRVTPAAPIESWTTVDLNIAYDLGDRTGTFLLDNTRLSLSVINLFDQDPPTVVNDADRPGFSPASFDSANANPLGRFISFSVLKSW